VSTTTGQYGRTHYIFLFLYGYRQGYGSGSGFNDFVDPDPWARKMKKKNAFFLNFLNIFIAKR
jgi:hypothetical protein